MPGCRITRPSPPTSPSVTRCLNGAMGWQSWLRPIRTNGPTSSRFCGASQKVRWRVVAALFRSLRNGISNIYFDRSEYISKRSRSVEQFIVSATRNFEYVGIYFSVATDQSRVDDSIKALVAKGCQVRLVLLDDQSSDETFRYLECAFALAPASLRQRVIHARNHFMAIREALAPGQRSLLELRLHQLPLLSSAFRIDAGEQQGAMLVDNKWYGVGREKSFGLEFLGAMKEGTLFETVSKSFAQISDQARPI
jgi:hypothetical protein